MIRSALIVSVLMFAAVDSASAQKPFKDSAVRKAQTTYRQALSTAKSAYKAELAKAHQKAMAAGDNEEAAKLKAEIITVEDPLGAVRRRITGSRFYSANGNNIQMLPNSFWKSSAGSTGTWVLTDKKTLVQQSYKTSAIVVWKFDDSYRKVTCYRFKRSNVKPYSLARK